MVLRVLCKTYKQAVPTKTHVAKTGLSAEGSFGGQRRSTDFCLTLSFFFFFLNCLSTMFSQVMMQQHPRLAEIVK